MFKKILLINPYYSNHYGAFLPAGLGYIAEVLYGNHIEYNVLDMGLGYTEEDVIREIKQYEPQLLAIQLMTYRHKKSYRLLNIIKRKYPGIKILAGGAHLSVFREKVLRDCTAIDYGIVLEGEETIIELCEGRRPSTIKGLVYRENGIVRYTGDREFIEDLDSIPFPKYRRFELVKYPSDVIGIVSSRGCPYACTYCPVKLVVGKKLRFRSSLSIVGEIEYWHNLGIKRLGFTDDNFTFNTDRVHKICDELEKRPWIRTLLLLGNGIRADRVNVELLKKMKRMGFDYIAFGVEGGNDQVLKSINKGEKIATIETAIQNACDIGFDVKLHFLIGSPGETISDVEDSIKLALKYPVSDVFFNNVIPYPGTQLYQWVQENGLLIKTPEYYLNEISPSSREAIFVTPEFSEKARKKAFRLADNARRKVRRRYYTKKLQRFGYFANVISSVFVSDIIQKKLLRNRYFNKAVRGIAYRWLA